VAIEPAAEQLDWMVRSQLASRGIRDERVLAAFRKVDRALFVPPHLRTSAYDDGPLPIGEGQTISQPYMVAIMTESLDLGGRERVLEIGAGSGYQTAILALVAAEVYAIEIHRPLAEGAQTVIERLGMTNVHIKVGDGRRGWPEEAPFDRVLCAAAAEEVPAAWLEQLADPGVLIMPIGGWEGQILRRVEKRRGRTESGDFCPCRFVPLVGHDGPYT
jgi:protein-L-isoaspartate(D-aspartate) O-methyltransferase